MEIQQKEKESLAAYTHKEKEFLAAYIHRFKREDKTCNFTNNTATICILVKGLKNTHTLVDCVYEKGPKTLSDAISEVEKLQTVQQLTATLLPSSTVNMMCNEGAQCFQCQELGHIACHCPNIRCFDCDEYGHVAADCPDRIPPSGTPAHQKRHHSNTRHLFLGIITGTGTGITGPNPSYIRKITKVTVGIAHTHTQAAPYHITDTLTGALHITVTQALIVTVATHHTEGHLHT